MSLFLIKTKNTILDILFPPLCINCHRHLTRTNADSTRTNTDKQKYENFICRDCYSLIKLNNTIFCPVCRARLAQNNTCHSNSYLLAAAGNYSDPILQNLIHYFKYKYFDGLTPLLGGLLIKYLGYIDPKFYILNSKSYIVVPIPLHSQRERKRGFNQAELLAEFIAKNMNIELIEGLNRIKDTESQSKQKNQEARNKNIVGCFKIRNPELIKGKNIILVDDVFTSGATMNEAVRVLKSYGAKKIIALVLAKA
ncbi:MAG: phosphoribosyltransferase family protein [Candidatus Paceibacterota bacterium]